MTGWWWTYSYMCTEYKDAETTGSAGQASNACISIEPNLVAWYTREKYVHATYMTDAEDLR